MKLQNWATLTSIQAGIYVCASALMTGVVLMKSYGLLTALASLVVGSIITWVLSMVFVHMGVSTRQPLIELINHALGRFGTLVSGVAFGISLVGWFAIQLNLMSHVLEVFLPMVSPLILKGALGAVFTLTVFRGMRSIAVIADFSTPFYGGCDALHHVYQLNAIDFAAFRGVDLQGGSVDCDLYAGGCD